MGGVWSDLPRREEEAWSQRAQDKLIPLLEVRCGRNMVFNGDIGLCILSVYSLLQY